MKNEVRAPLTLPDVPPLPPPDDLGARLAELGVTLDDAAVTTLGAFLARLLAMNAQMNLTAITDPAEAWTRHALDALSLVPKLRSVGAAPKVVDVGSGGGVPAIPLAIACPEARFTLVEATQKKAHFLEEVAAALGLGNVRVVAERAEQAIASPLRGSFDVVTARAVGRLASLLRITAPFARRGGTLLLVKGQRADEEIAEARYVLKSQHLEHRETVLTPTGRIVVLVKNPPPPR